MQQANPWTGEMTTSKRDSPAMLVLVDFKARLHGVHRHGEAQLAWNVVPGVFACGDVARATTFGSFAVAEGAMAATAAHKSLVFPKT